jgi:hypothetical protein
LTHRQNLQVLRRTGGGGAGGGGGGRGGGHSAAAVFGGFAFGPRYGILEALAGAGPAGAAIGGIGLAAEFSLGVLNKIVKTQSP